MPDTCGVAYLNDSLPKDSYLKIEENQVELPALRPEVRPTVLVVDDAIDNLMVMEAILADDYRLKLFSDAQEAFDYAFTNSPDLILLDVMMPGIDGHEFCRRLKANPKLSEIPVIFITSKSNVQDEELGFSVGAVDYIHKPVSAPLVVARVKTHLKVKFMMDFINNESHCRHKNDRKLIV